MTPLSSKAARVLTAATPGADVIRTFDCPVCHFWKNTKEGPCRRVGCSGVVVIRDYYPEARENDGA